MPAFRRRIKKRVAFQPSPTEGATNALSTNESVRAAKAVVERIARPAHGADRISHAPAIDRLAQPADMHVHGALVDIDFAAPDAVEQLLSLIHI